jgi:hypothetical protein
MPPFTLVVDVLYLAYSRGINRFFKKKKKKKKKFTSHMRQNEAESLVLLLAKLFEYRWASRIVVDDIHKYPLSS